MRIQVTVALKGDEGELSDWLDNQDIIEVTYHSDYDETVTGDALTVFTIEPAQTIDTPILAAGAAQVWSRFVLQLLSQQLCY
jgi:type 1 glutamine amidotransferase